MTPCMTAWRLERERSDRRMVTIMVEWFVGALEGTGRQEKGGAEIEGGSLFETRLWSPGLPAWRAWSLCWSHWGPWSVTKPALWHALYLRHLIWAGLLRLTTPIPCFSTLRDFSKDVVRSLFFTAHSINFIPVWFLFLLKITKCHSDGHSSVFIPLYFVAVCHIVFISPPDILSCQPFWPHVIPLLSHRLLLLHFLRVLLVSLASICKDTLGLHLGHPSSIPNISF